MSHDLIAQLEDRVLTVPEYLDLVNELLSPLRVAVEGEVTDLKLLREWAFFSLKDAESGALLRCGLHAQQYRRIGVNMEEGMQVKVTGYGKISPKTGNFGFWVSTIEPVGEGALRRAYELLIEKLRGEGLFARKRELPQFIRHIGVISSRNGVVLQDLRQNLEPLGIRIDFLHSGVEGADSARELLQAVEWFSQAPERPDVLVLIRGGGSLESLQGFNNETVARAIFASPMPVLVGIGHDVDMPIATLVADWSASTPTAVAHVINASWSPLTEALPRLTTALLVRYRRHLESTTTQVLLHERTVAGAVRTMLSLLGGVGARVLQHALRGREWVEVLRTRVARSLMQRSQGFVRMRQQAQDRVGLCERLINASDPSRMLARGFALPYGSDGKLVRSVRAVTVGDALSLRLHDGTLNSTVTDVTEGESKQIRR